MRKYGRNDVEYEIWYSTWMKRLAKQKTRKELETELSRIEGRLSRETSAHLDAINKTTSMSGNSMARAHSRNNVSCSGDYSIALSGAIEIHDLFPEEAKNEQ